MFYALKRFQRSISTLESSIEKIGTSQLDEHMDTAGHYQEIRYLIDANNHMIDRMNEYELRRVLTRLYRSDANSDKIGYGLGLPIALKIAKKHGGTIEVESKSGRDSRFMLYLEKK